MAATKKRVRTRKNSLSAYYSKRERDIMFCYPTSAADGHYMHTIFDSPRYDYDGKTQPSFVKELEARGYDITTLRFSILKKEAPATEAEGTRQTESPAPKTEPT